MQSNENNMDKYFGLVNFLAGMAVIIVLFVFLLRGGLIPPVITVTILFISGLFISGSWLKVRVAGYGMMLGCLIAYLLMIIQFAGSETIS